MPLPVFGKKIFFASLSLKAVNFEQLTLAICDAMQGQGHVRPDPHLEERVRAALPRPGQLRRQRRHRLLSARILA